MRAALDANRVADACRMAARLVDQGRATPPATQLDALRLWIDCLARRGALDQAERWLDRREPEARTAPALVAYGRALVAVTRAPSGLEAALRGLQRAARAWPREAEIPFRCGLLALANEQPAVARAQLLRACALRASAACWAALAHAELDLGHDDAALITVRRVLEADPRPADVRRGRAVLQRLARRRGRLAPAIGRAVARAQHEAVAALQDAQPQRAVEVLRRAAAQLPGVAALQRMLGLAELRAANTAEALQALLRAREIDPLDAMSARYAAEIYRERALPAQALGLLRAALVADPFSVAVARALGGLLEQQRQPKSAAIVYERWVVLERSVGAHHAAARARLAAGQGAQAQAHFERVLALAPDDYLAHRQLAQLLARRARASRDADEAQGWRVAAREHARRAAALVSRRRETRRPRPAED
ncbi:MAG: tetratricopeptide repeat protein [Proteobacteria bacterium]|nr:tetratricopeptide repeat protein [Pseudomonadota bacterium]